MIATAYCDECRHRHPIDFDPRFGIAASARGAAADWYRKHAGHVGVGFRMPGRSTRTRVRVNALRNRVAEFLRRPLRAFGGDLPTLFKPFRDPISEYLDNADIKIAYAASASVTITLASLAASSTLLAGRESTAIDNGASNKYLDKLTSGYFKSAASNNQAGSIYCCAVAARDDTPNWPDVFDGTDSAETVSLQAIFDQVCKFMAAIACTSAASTTWYFGLESLAARYGGWVPDQYVYFVTHNVQTSTNAWSSTESDHDVMETGVYATST